MRKVGIFLKIKNLLIKKTSKENFKENLKQKIN